MVNIYTAYTAPINRPGETAILTTSQVWKGLQRKVRKAQEFVPAIVACEVLDENDSSRTVERRIMFKGEQEWVKERCVEFEGVKVDFHQENGSTISNVISEGSGGELYMTYVFEWLHPDIGTGSKEEGELKGKHEAVAKMAVEKSIDSIRRMVGEGIF